MKLPDRIRSRPVLSAAWLISAILLLASIVTFYRGIGCYGSTRQVLFIGGGVLIQGAPPGSPTSGVHTFKVDMPNRSLGRIYGFLRMPQFIGKAFWIPLGFPLAIICPIITLRLMREEK
jgi:hypothetical protein